MNFITIGQYFNKLQSVLLFMLIVPLLVFIALYFHVSGMPPDPPDGILHTITSHWASGLGDGDDNLQ